MRLERGSIVSVDLDPTQGHEQRGVRPCVVVGEAEVIAASRFPMVCVVPITGTEGKGALYPRLVAGRSGLVKPSWALVDQLRSVDKSRLRRVYGRVAEAELAAIEDGLRLFLGLDT